MNSKAVAAIHGNKAIEQIESLLSWLAFRDSVPSTLVQQYMLCYQMQLQLVCQLAWMCCSGQQQLLCLARVLLEQPKVVCLDEAMANMDPETARLMQHILATHLRDSTVLQIAHRLDAVLDCDWVIVMDQGRVVEQGSPQELLNSQTHFAAMYQASGSL